MPMVVYVCAVIILLAGLVLVFRRRVKAKYYLTHSYRTLIENIPQKIFLKSRDYKFVSVNKAFAEELHLRPIDFVGKVDYDLYSKELADKYRADDSRIMAAGQSEEFEEQHLDHGKRIWVNTTKVPVRDHTGEVTGILGIFWDVTEQKLAREQLRDSNQRLTEALAELRRTQQQVLEQEKLRGLGQMASGLAHDINNALSPIIGFSELLLKHPEKRNDPTQLVKWLQNIHTCANDAANVVRRMREFGRQQIGSEPLTPVDLNQLILKTIEFTESAWKAQVQSSGRTIHVATDLTPVPLIPGAESGLREMLASLILNAVEAMLTGGTIIVSTAVEEGFVRVQVRDTGQGMSEEIRQRCLEPFFTTKSGHEGTGLGLAMAQSTVKRHGGTITVDSFPGQGTTMIVRLPTHDGAREKIFLTESATSNRSLSVLVVDDQPELCEIVTEYLKTDGHTVVSAGGGALALTEIRNRQFDLVITDKAMPEMNGEQLAAAIHQTAPNLPVILLTGFGDLMKAAGEMPAHIKMILSKPVDQMSLRDALAKVIR